VEELRFNRIKCTANDLLELFNTIKNCKGSKRLTKLRISYIEVSDIVLSAALIDMVKAMD
jgi:hypothetical protein